jgi:hypothetical protein
MKSKRKGQPNYAALGAIAFSVLCWVGLYAVWADFGETGVELLQVSGVLRSLEATVLLGLNAFGLLVLGTFAAGGIALLVRALHPDARHDSRFSGRPHPH